MIRALIFDMDDTLYPEREFILGGYRAAGALIEARGGPPATAVAAVCEAILRADGRDNVLDKAVRCLGLPTAWVPELVTAFRAHTPAIDLFEDAARALPRLRGRFRLGCVTDGWREVQRRKIAALDLERALDATIVADDLGRQHWKPDPAPFYLCCELLGVAPREALVIGDNPSRDLEGARNAGIAAVRMRRTGDLMTFRDAVSPPGTVEVADLEQLEALLARQPQGARP